MNGDPQHSGNNTQETILGRSNVANLALLFQVTLPSVADGAPAFLGAVNTVSGPRDFLFVTTKAGHIIAIDARTGATLWSHQYPAGSCRINLGSSLCYTTSSPAIDPNRQYVYSYGLDGRVHKYSVGDGVEIVEAGWPAIATLKGFNEKGSSALSTATASSGASYLYVTNGGYPGDAGDYQGHVTAINLADGSQRVFNALCSDQALHFVQTPGTPDCSHVQGAIWARVGVVYDTVTDRIFMATGNGLYDGNAGGHEWGDSVFALNPDGTGAAGKPLDSYTPTNFQQLSDADLDLGSTAPAILPAAGFTGRLAVQGGKDAMLRLINLANLSGQGGPGHLAGELQILPVPQGGLVLSAPAVWVNPADGSTWVFVTTSSGISGLKLTFPSGAPTLVTQWQKSQGGFSPLLANNVLYHAASEIVRALDPTTGALLWSDSTHVGGIHWESPVVADGALYLTDESGHLTAWTPGPSISSIAPASGPTTGATPVTLTGSNFSAGAIVTFGGVAATDVNVPDPQTIQAVTPPHGGGFVTVQVTNPSGSSGSLPAGFQYVPASIIFPVTLLPDGRSVTATLPAGGAFYRCALVAGRSYAVEVDTLDTGAGTVGAGGPAPVVSLTRSNGSALTGSVVNRGACSPALPARATLQPAAADVAAGPIDVVVSDASASGYSFRVRLAEMSLFCPRWSVNGYAAFIDIQNTSACTVSGAVTLTDGTGSTIGTLPFSLAAASATQIAVPSGLSPNTGSAVLTHDGPPGSIAAGIYMTQPGAAQTSFRWPFREVRSYGATDGK